MKTRITRDELYIEVANSFAKRGTCARLQVGAVAVFDGRIICTGYNGALKNGRNPSHSCNCDTTKPCEKAIHAEANLISFAAKNGIALQGSTLYVTHSPCLKCSELIIQSGIVSVVYDSKFRDQSGIELLTKNHIFIKEF